MLSIKEFKIAWKERAILDPAERFAKTFLGGIGAYTRQVAKNSMLDVGTASKRKLAKVGFSLDRQGQQTSRPGSAAFSKLGHIKKHIYFAVDTREKTVVIGPAKLTGVKSENAVETLEKGGTEQIFIGRKRRVAITATYKPRPTMQLALEAALKKKAPHLLRGGINREA